jgi:hypothetical protein
MKTVLLAAGTFAALALALPAAAQQGYGYGYRDPIHQQFQRLENRIDRGAQTGKLTRHEHRALRSEFSQLVRLDSYYRRDGGLSRGEYMDLQHRTERLQAKLRWERRDGDRYDRRGEGYGYGGGYGYRY